MKSHFRHLFVFLPPAALAWAASCTAEPTGGASTAGSGTQAGGFGAAASVSTVGVGGATDVGASTTGLGGNGGAAAPAGSTAGSLTTVGAGGGVTQPIDPSAVTFSVPSGTFEGSLSVTMTTGSAGGEIRYTTDGLPPTAASTLYDGAPLVLGETTQLRAQVFAAGAATGASSTAIYIRRTFDTTSDIPLVIMEAYGGGKPPTQAGPEKVVFRDLAFMLFEPVAGTAALSQIPTWASRAGYHVRGQSSASFEKTPYRVELWDEQNEDADYPMIGMPADSDWAMVGPYTDKTLVRNAFAYSLAADMGLEAPELRFVEVYLNQDAGPLEATDYEGVYAVTETIKNNKGRLDLEQLRPEDTLEPDIAGGYIFKFDLAALREDEGEIEIPCIGEDVIEPMDAGPEQNTSTCFSDLELTDPVAPNPEQLAWIQAYVQQAHDALVAQPIGAYQQFLDLPSFVDIILLNELTKGGDKYVRSVYLHKHRQGPIKAGPVWDYNFTLNNYTPELEGWQVESGRDDSSNWFKILFVQPEFRAAAAARWSELRQGVFSDAQLDARIDAVSAPLVNAGPRDLERWPVGEADIFGGGRGPGGDEDEVDPEVPTTWEGQIADVKQWVKARAAWVDSEIATF